jgi:hypothetical protein
VPPSDELGSGGGLLLVHVAQRDDLGRRDLDQAEEVHLAVPARADQPRAQRFLIGGPDVRRERGSGGDDGSGLQKCATVHDLLQKLAG